ncbi:MAG: hypothetical protein ACK46X_02775 [Candidatus Sericytochromatia bacterium]
MFARLFLCGLVVLSTGACVRSNPVGVLRATPAKSPGATKASPSSAPSPAASGAPGAALVVPKASPSPASAKVHRLGGIVAVPPGLEASTANVKGGLVVGSPVRVVEAATGRVLKQGVTYYDGSFQIDLPAPTSAAPALISVDLVDAKDDQKTTTLELPLLLQRDIGVVEGLTVTAGTTALVMLYRRWAEAEPKDDEPSTFGLARYILATSADTTQSFGLLVAQDPQIPASKDVTALKAAIEGYVARAQTKKETKR